MKPLIKSTLLFTSLVLIFSGIALRRAEAIIPTAYVVNSTADPGDGICDATCTLRDAINAANNDGVDSDINFAPGLSGTINLASELPVLQTTMTLNGPGATLLTVRRNTGGNYRVFTIFGVAGTTVSISGLTISNGRTPDGTASGNSSTSFPGGGIYNSIVLTVSDCIITGNSTGNGGNNSTGGFGGFGGHGGGIFNIGTLTLINSTISGNSTGNGGQPNSSTGSTTGGYGGSGGGIARSGTSPLTIINCTISGNSTGNGGPGGGSGSNGGDGGGIYLLSGPITLTNSTITGNKTGRGIINITPGANPRGGSGGGIYRNPFTNVSSELNLQNTLVAGNTFETPPAPGTAPPGTGPDVSGAVISQGNNLIGKGDGSTGLTNGVNNDNVGTSASPINPLLGPLQNNGGQTLTHALLGGSPALDAGSNSVTGPPLNLTTDQRHRQRRIGVAVDIGAYEAGVALGDFDRDLRTEIAVWNPASHNWYILQSATGTQHVQLDWGNGSLGDVAVPGDYDGDGKTDIAVYRSSEGNWYIIRSSDNTVLLKNWGLSTDVPVPGDYDGDGSTDITVFRPAEGTWYVLKSSGGSQVQGWGANGDKPLAGDFDGDGKADFAVWRPSDSNWYVLQSGGSSFTQVWGLNGDKLVPADYNGDGRTDIAVFRPADGNWYIRNSGGGVTIRNWGGGTDIPVPGDYDGDGRADIAIFRPGEGTWYILRSSNGSVLTQYLGQSGDVPVPNSYLPQ